MTGFFDPHSFESGGGGGLIKRIPQCGKCGLRRKCQSPKMKVAGNGRLPILFVGTAPDEEEDQEGTPFIGEGGQYLRGVLSNLGWDLADGWMTNAVICKPHRGKVRDDQVLSCRPHLIQTIEKLKPKVIIPLGMPALNSLLTGVWAKEKGTISKWVGWKIPIQEYGAWVCPTFDPLYPSNQEKNVILRNEFKKHLTEALPLWGREIPHYSLDKFKRKVEVILSPSEAKKRILDLSKKKGFLAFDYETTGLKPDRKEQEIVSVSFCLDGIDTFACLITPEIMDPLKQVLINPDLKKIASNLKFEDRWTRKKLGCKVSSWYWDTMLVAHCLDNRSGITSVKFQTFIHFGIGDYDSHIGPFLKARSPNEMNQIRQLDPKDLLVYNGLDSLFEYKVMEKQRKVFTKCQN